MQPCEMLGRLAGKHREQARSEPGSQDAVNNITLFLFGTILFARDAVEKKLIRGLFYNFRNTTHNLWDQGPCQRGNQDTDHPAAPTSQPGRGDAGHECLLFHEAQDALTCGRAHVWLLVQYPRDRGFGDTG